MFVISVASDCQSTRYLRTLETWSMSVQV